MFGTFYKFCKISQRPHLFFKCWNAQDSFPSPSRERSLLSICNNKSLMRFLKFSQRWPLYSTHTPLSSYHKTRCANRLASSSCKECLLGFSVGDPLCSKFDSCICNWTLRTPQFLETKDFLMFSLSIKIWIQTFHLVDRIAAQEMECALNLTPAETSIKIIPGQVKGCSSHPLTPSTSLWVITHMMWSVWTNSVLKPPHKEALLLLNPVIA